MRPEWSRAAALALLLLLALPALSAPRVGLVTMAPGEEYWARFGHNALLVDAGDGSEPTFYNFGYFDFEQPGFFWRFLRGEMRYLAVALPMSQDLRSYAADGRGARLQWLDLAPAEIASLSAALAEHVLPENAEYRYDYFTSNCSTKLRDALDDALGGALKRQLEGRSQGLTYRSEARRHAAALPWMEVGMHLGLGPMADRPLSVWEQAFIPEHLAQALREVRSSQGGPMVLAEHELLPHQGPRAAANPPDRFWLLLSAGLVLAVLLARALRGPRAARWLALWWGLSGLVGVGLLLLWLGTAHEAAWANRNLLLFNPLGLLLALACLFLHRQGRAPQESRLRLFGGGLLGLSLFGLVLAHMPVYPQQQLDWMGLVLPLQLATAWALLRR
jgi:hypothetical protein